LLFCVFYTAVFTFIRELSMEMVLRSLAKWLALSKSKQSRFMEQCYALIYFTVFGFFGLVTFHPPFLISLLGCVSDGGRLVRDVNDSHVAFQHDGVLH
jgi:hypothetical protein